MSYTAAQNSRFVDNVERMVLDQLEDNKPDMVRSIYTEVPWNEGDGEVVTFNSIALSGVSQRVDENEDFVEVNPAGGNELTKKQIQFGDKLNISRRMMKFNNRFSQAKFGAESLAKRNRTALDHEMTMQLFSEADQTTFKPKGKTAYNIATSDGQPVASASHVYGGQTFSNIISGNPVLSQTALDAGIQQGQQDTPDDFGSFLSPDYDTLIIHENPYMVNKAHQLFGSSLTPESGNNAVNYYGGPGSFKVIALKHGNKDANFSTTTDNIYRWILMDSDMVRQSCQVMIAGQPTTEQVFTDSDNLAAKILSTQFASYAIVQPQGLMYSLATSAPTIS